MTVRWLIQRFREDARFRQLAPSSQRLYGYMFKVVESFIGDALVTEVTRADANAIYNEFSHTKRKASQVIQVARPLFQYAYDMDWITKNPFAQLGVKKAKPRQTIVPAEYVEKAKARAIEMGLASVAYAIQIAYDFGQRPGDIRTLPRRNYDGRWLRVVQSKGGAILDLPVFMMPELKTMLDNLAHDSTLILHDERAGAPYTKDRLCRRVREVFEAAGITRDIQFRDLRRTSVVRLAEAGCELAEICAFTGHRLAEAHKILEVYLPRTRKMAENAAMKLRRAEAIKLRNQGDFGQEWCQDCTRTKNITSCIL
jgi:integrase